MRGPGAKLVVLGAVVMLVAAGCGGGGGSSGSSAANQSFNSYESAMQALGRQLGSAIAASGNKNISASPAVITHNLRQVQVALRAAAGKLERITPPDNVKAQHRLLIKGVREYANELDGVIAQVNKGNSRFALGSIVTLKGVKDMERATKSIAKAGYVIVAP